MFDVIDFILNVAGLLLWLNWRSVRLDPFNRGIPATLAGTVRRAEPMRLKRWHFLAALSALLFIRAYCYEHIGPSVNWTPKLNLAVVMPAFPLVIRGHVFFLSALLFSVLSFIRVLVIFCFWLLALAVLNRRQANLDPLQKLLLLQLGPAARWPLFIQAILPVVVVVALWLSFHSLLVLTGVTTAVKSNTVLLAQGLVVSLIVYLSLRYLLFVIVLAHMIASYVYLGTNPIWDFVNTTARNILSPLNRLPLRFGRADLAPVLGIILIILLLYLLPNYVIHVLNGKGLTAWPE